MPNPTTAGRDLGRAHAQSDLIGSHPAGRIYGMLGKRSGVDPGIKPSDLQEMTHHDLVHYYKETVPPNLQVRFEVLVQSRFNEIFIILPWERVRDLNSVEIITSIQPGLAHRTTEGAPSRLITETTERVTGRVSRMTRSADLSIDKLGEPDGEQMLNRHLSALVMMHNETMKLDAVTDLWNAGMHTMYQNFIFGTQRNDLMSRLMMDAVQAFAWHKIPKYPYEMRLMLQRSLPVNSTLNFMIVDQEMVDRDRFKEEFETDLSKRGIKALDNLEGPAGTVVTQSQLPVLIQSHTVPFHTQRGSYIENNPVRQVMTIGGFVMTDACNHPCTPGFESRSDGTIYGLDIANVKWTPLSKVALLRRSRWFNDAGVLIDPMPGLIGDPATFTRYLKEKNLSDADIPSRNRYTGRGKFQLRDLFVSHRVDAQGAVSYHKVARVGDFELEFFSIEDQRAIVRCHEGLFLPADARVPPFASARAPPSNLGQFIAAASASPRNRFGVPSLPAAATAGAIAVGYDSWPGLQTLAEEGPAKGYNAEQCAEARRSVANVYRIYNRLVPNVYGPDHPSFSAANCPDSYRTGNAALDSVCAFVYSSGIMDAGSELDVVGSTTPAAGGRANIIAGAPLADQGRLAAAAAALASTTVTDIIGSDDALAELRTKFAAAHSRHYDTLDTFVKSEIYDESRGGFRAEPGVAAAMLFKLATDLADKPTLNITRALVAQWRASGERSAASVAAPVGRTGLVVHKTHESSVSPVLAGYRLNQESVAILQSEKATDPSAAYSKRWGDLVLGSDTFADATAANAAPEKFLHRILMNTPITIEAFEKLELAGSPVPLQVGVFRPSQQFLTSGIIAGQGGIELGSIKGGRESLMLQTNAEADRLHVKTRMYHGPFIRRKDRVITLPHQKCHRYLRGASFNWEGSGNAQQWDTRNGFANKLQDSIIIPLPYSRRRHDYPNAINLAGRHDPATWSDGSQMTPGGDMDKGLHYATALSADDRYMFSKFNQYLSELRRHHLQRKTIPPSMSGVNLVSWKEIQWNWNPHTKQWDRMCDGHGPLGGWLSRETAETLHTGRGMFARETLPPC